MRILALITARGGSKRLPGKNIKLLGDKPLIVWSIDVAKGIPDICDILVSTDDPAVAMISKEAGAFVPWLRPSELATDTASSVEVALHALNWYESTKGSVDGILLLQPTSPFRTQQTVKRGIKLFSKNNQQTVLGISAINAHPMWSLKMEGDYLVPFMQDHGFGRRSQDLPSAYAVNGSFYLITPLALRNCRSFLTAKTIPLLIESEIEALDIDTEWDWSLAEKSLNI
jgi:CMP-N,N'-diacetyllegionaminic acid synthase